MKNQILADKMERDYFIKLTSVVYEASKWWPENNLLKFKLRNLANEILIDFILLSYENPGLAIQNRIFNNIEAIENVFGIARRQKLLDRNDFLLLKREYSLIRTIIKGTEKEKRGIRKEKIAKIAEKQTIFQNLSARQEKILQILGQKQKAQVGELKEFFIDTSKRTLRRDLEDLLKRNLVQRDGEWNRIFYVLNK